MKKLLPVVIASLAASSYAVAGGHATASAPTVYGKVNVSLNNNDYEGAVGSEQDNWTLNSNASRIGVKGSYALTSKTKAIYKAEYEYGADDGVADGGSGDEFKSRNVVVGFQGEHGTILVGKHDTPLKMSQGKVDRFNDLELGDIGDYIDGDEREENIIMYKSPSFNGVTVTAAFIPGEEEGASAERDGLSDGTSIAIEYKAGDLRVALAANSDTEQDGGDDTDVTRFTVEYKVLPELNLGLLINNSEDDNTDSEQDAWLISGAYSLSNTTTFNFQYGVADNETGATDWEVTQTAIGLDYNFNKTSKVYAYFSQIESEATGDPEDSTFAIGYQVKF